MRDCSIHPLPTIDPRTIVLERQRHTQLGLTDVEAAAFVSPIGAGLPEASKYESLSMRSFVHMKHDLYALRFTLSFVSVWIAIKPKRPFTSRHWHVRDTKPCEHGKVRCQCAQCVFKKATCVTPNCKTRPSFNVPGQPAKYCKEHAKIGMENGCNCRIVFSSARTRLNAYLQPFGQIQFFADEVVFSKRNSDAFGREIFSKNNK